MSVTTGLAQSVQARLVQRAKVLDVDPSVLLARYATERFLYRLSLSPYSEQFVLKGALVLLARLGETLRPTRDADLLGFEELDEEAVVRIFIELCALSVEPDGLVFDDESIHVVPIREEEAYGGMRVTLFAHLGSARLRVRVDIGLGDAAEPEWIEYPSLLDLPRPRLRAYSMETVVAEKVHAMVLLGSRNSRMRDFFDVSTLASHEPFDGGRLSEAIAATFRRRRTDIPSQPPVALTPPFAEIEDKRVQWDSFLRKSRLSAGSLEETVGVIAAFVQPVLHALATGERFLGAWLPGGPWKEPEPRS